MGRELLMDPYWPLHAGARLSFKMSWPAAYSSVAPEGAPLRTAMDSADRELAPEYAGTQS